MIVTNAYEPLSSDNIATNLRRELCDESPKALDQLEGLKGPGVYAIYYNGNLPLYKKLSESFKSGQMRWPIYVGRTENSLGARLKNHQTTLKQARLQLSDFRFAFLELGPLWIAFCEKTMLDYYKPVWNVIAKGFGNHDPGKGRHKGMVSNWDVLHPGRPWAANLKGATNSATDLRKQVKKHLNKTIP